MTIRLNTNEGGRQLMPASFVVPCSPTHLFAGEVLEGRCKLVAVRDCDILTVALLGNAAQLSSDLRIVDRDADHMHLPVRLAGEGGRLGSRVATAGLGATGDQDD